MPDVTPPRRLTIALAALCLLAVAVGGYRLGVRSTERANWHTVTVDLAGVAADEDGPYRLLSVTDDGWTYAIEDSVPWTDAGGTLHDRGWPACLEPAHPGFMSRNHERVRFRFAEVSVDAGGVGSRPVMMVDCRRPV